MNFRDYKKYICIIAVIAVIDIVSCVILAVIVPLVKKNEAVQVCTTAETVQKTLPDIIKTDGAESFSSLIENLGALKYNYPELLKLYTAGYSEAGRELLTVTLGNGPKKALLLGAVHAREHITTKYLLCCIETYCKAYYSPDGFFENYNVKDLLDAYTLYIIPCVNPDGLEIIRSRENPQNFVNVSTLSEYKANKNGVDLNRNFPLAWEQINNNVTRPSECFYKGSSPACASETKAIMKLCDENSFEFAISFHIKGNCIYWGDNYDTSLNAQYKTFAGTVAGVSGLYMTKPTEKAKDYGGGFENWFRHKYSHPGICVELMDNELKNMPTDNSNYINFYKTVNFEKTVFVTLEAMKILY